LTAPRFDDRDAPEPLAAAIFYKETYHPLMAKKVSIKKLVKEQDAFFSITDRIYNFYLDNSKRILIAAALVVVIVVAVIVFLSVGDSRRKEASLAYFSAIDQYDPGRTLAAMEKVREEWSGTPSDRAAAYMMVDSYVKLERFQEGRDLLTELYKTLPQGEESLRVLIANYLGGLSEELGDNEAALAYYLESNRLAAQSVAPPQVTEPFRRTLLSSVARTYLALGQLEDAKTTLNQLSAGFPDTVEGLMAELRLRELAKAAPATPATPAAAGDAPADDGAPAADGDQPEGDAVAPEGDAEDPQADGDKPEAEADDPQPDAAGDAPAAGGHTGHAHGSN
jgi:predicted negative regulator of RcsB-dependent stress response